MIRQSGLYSIRIPLLSTCDQLTVHLQLKQGDTIAEELAEVLS
jgi:hypothetical protein